MNNRAPLVTEAGPEDTDQLRARLLHSLRSSLPQATNQTITLVIKDENGDLIAGISGSTSYGWLHIELLWVTVRQRQRGLARALLAAAEAKARPLGCHAVWLETSNPEARASYENLGFVLFGELANTPSQSPPGHHRWFFRKAIIHPET